MAAAWFLLGPYYELAVVRGFTRILWELHEEPG